MMMLSRWVPAGLLLSSVVSVSPTTLAQSVPTKPAVTTAKPATTVKPTTTTKPATSPTAAKPTAPPAAGATASATPDPKAAGAAPTDAKAPAPDAKPAAPTTTPQSDADKELTRLLEDAKKATKASQWDKARELYAAAYKLKPDHATLLLLAQAEAKSSRPRDAAEHLEAYLREATTASADDKATAKKLFDEVTAKLGTWYVKVTIDGADLFLNGKPVGRSPLPGPIFVEPGSAEIEARKEGYLPEKELLAIAPNTESETVLAMKPAPAATKPIKPKADKDIPKPPPPPPSPAWRTYGMIGGGALTVFGLGLGIGLTVSAGSKGEEADDQLDQLKQNTPNTYNVCGTGPTVFQANIAPCARLKDTLASQDARANGAVAGFVIAGVGAVGTAGLFLLPKLSFGRKLMSMKITPVVGIDRLGGTVSGSF